MQFITFNHVFMNWSLTGCIVIVCYNFFETCSAIFLAYRGNVFRHRKLCELLSVLSHLYGDGVLISVKIHTEK